MSLSTQPYKGARDFYPEDKRIQKYMFGKLRQIVESFGYQEYDAPIIELFDIYTAKSGEELVNDQLYSFVDRGDRKVAIRPEMTPTVSRMVAGRRQELAYPLRWYSIPNLWRYERPQKGRLREHWQLNVDIFGVEGKEADQEIIQIADSVLKSFGATGDMYEIKVNSRAAMKELLEKAGYNGDIIPKIIGAFDRLGKTSFQPYLNENFDENDKTKLEEFVDKTSGDDILATNSGANLSTVIQRLKAAGIDVKPDVSINRGFDYYTDIVFEVFDKDPENNRSLFGGGRYDGLVAEFGVEAVPTVGFGMGDVTLQNFLESHNLLPKLKPETDATIILVGDVYENVQNALAELRQKGIKVAVDSSGRKLDAQIKNAVKSGVRYAIFIGEQELESSTFKLRDLEKGEEKNLNLEEIASTLLAARPE
ncbi:histidine--tRNA ligase [Candidatus Saccharibacteria bacterium]|nr:histidine--tRNA ligase [Candidatus Saccharibacteria bacterium]